MRGKHLTKILGLALLVAVGIMAVSASAAQAKWLLLRNKVSVLKLELTAELLLSELLVPLENLAIHCTGGTGNAILSLDATHTKLTGSASGTFTGCTVLEFTKTCTVHSPGKAGGTIFAEGEGEGKMEGEKTYALVEDPEFTRIEIEGPLCPFDETSEPVNGSATLTILNQLEDAVTHLVQLDDEELFFGKEKAILEGELLNPVSEPGVHDPWVLAHVKEVAGQTWAIHLVGL